MRSVDDTAQNSQSLKPELNLPVSRRDVLITGSATAGTVSVTGIPSAATDEVSTESTESSKTCLLTIMITGLEVGGPMADVIVECAEERKMTDESGTVMFDVEDGTYEVTVEKERWGSVMKTIEMNGQHQEIHIPIHIKKYNDLNITVCDASLGTPVQTATVTVEGYGTTHTDATGAAMVMIENMLEPTTHDLMVTADGYHNETRRVIMADDKQLCIELLPK